MDSLPAEPQRKPKNTVVGSLTLSPTDLPGPEIELGSPALQADSLPLYYLGRLLSHMVVLNFFFSS